MCSYDLPSFLSSQVKTILVSVGEPYSKCRSDEFVFLNPCCTFNWEKIGTILKIPDEFSIHNEQPQWFSEKVHELWPVFIEAHSFIFQSLSSLHNVLKFCTWTTHPQEIEEYFKLFMNSEISTTEAILFLTIVIERSLGNVSFHYNSLSLEERVLTQLQEVIHDLFQLFLLKGTHVPSLLRDLLSMPEMLIILGKVPVLFLQILMGTPLGLNLRNVVWHGFPRPDELYPHFVSTLFVLIVSIGELLQQLNIDCSTIPKRSQTKFSCNIFNDIFPNTKKHPCETLKILFRSNFIPLTHQFYWKCAVELYSNGKNGRSLILLLPQFEHMLRCVYCSVNNCPERYLTAESVVLYTTMNEILAENLTLNDKTIQVNKFVHYLGEPIMEMLQDLFVHQAGPRVRDKISHGECNLDDIPDTLVNQVMLAALLIRMKSENLKEIKTMNSDQVIVYKNLILPLSNSYETKFHPVSVLKRSIEYCLSELNTWYTRTSQFCDLINMLSTDNEDSELSLLVKQVKINFLGSEKFSNSGKLITYIKFLKIHTMFREKSEYELITILRQIMENVEQINHQVAENLKEKCILFSQHSLRSRQRNTFQRMLHTIPNLKEIMFCVIGITVSLLEDVNGIYKLSTKEFEKLMKLCRAILQFVQNMTSYTKCDKNRWLEIESLALRFCHNIMENADTLCTCKCKCKIESIK